MKGIEFREERKINVVKPRKNLIMYIGVKKRFYGRKEENNISWREEGNNLYWRKEKE